MTRRVVLYGVVFVAALSAAAGAQQPPGPAAQQRGRIVGVFDAESGDPIADAAVADVSTDSVAHTEAHGLVELSRFHSHNDSVVVSISKTGFLDTTVVVMVGPADTVPLQVDLRRASVLLPAVAAMALDNLSRRRQAELEQRRRDGISSFVSRDELQKRDGVKLTDILSGRYTETVCVFSINGQPHLSAGEAHKALERYTGEFEAIERYSPTVPEFLRRSVSESLTCAYVLWTRSPSSGE